MTSTYTANNYDFRDFDDDDEISDDEVFVNDKKRSILDDDNGVNKPLMAPRRKIKTHKLHTEVRRGTRCRTTCLPACYILIAIGSLIGIICLVVFLVQTFAENLNTPTVVTHSDDLVGCTRFQVKDVWTQTLPKLTTETAFRLLDVNGDGTLDVVLGFGTGVDGYNVPSIVCDVYFDGLKPCFGGVLALDGRTGQQLWRHYTDHEVFALNCNEDLNKDGIPDCVAGGRAGVLQAISGKNGELIWDFGSQEAKNDIMNVYTPQMIPDQDGDDVFDVLVVHGGDPLAEAGSAFRLSGRLIVISGKTGKVIQWTGVPDKRESYYSPQLLQHPDGSHFVVFGTGGETHPGSLWLITLDDLLKGNVYKATAIYQDLFKGVMTPPVIVDVNGDSIDDIVMAMFNSTVVAFDGLTFEQLWNFTFQSSETYSTPAAGYFNDDDIPDFLVKYLQGPGFPLYYFAETTVLDGRDGKPILGKQVRDTIGTQASSLTITMEGHGNDVFLYWLADCLGHEGESKQFDFLKGTTVHEQSRADMCHLRFKTDLVTRMLAINQHVKPPGFVVYSSEDRKFLENSNVTNTSAIAQKYLATHTDVAHAYHIQSSQFQDKSRVHNPKKPQHDDAARRGHRKNKQMKEMSSEIEEDINYPESHTVRKHGRYRPRPAENVAPNGRYYDYGIEDDMPHLQQQPQWSSDTVSYSRDGDDMWNGNPQYDAGLRYQTIENSPYDAQNDYRLFNVQDQYVKPRRQHHRQQQQQQAAWNRNPIYGLKYRQQLKRSLTKKSMKSDTSRAKRHVGPHDMDGIQRVIATGTLAPVLDPTSDNANHSIDIIFATYWFFPSKTQAILPEDRDCIQNRMSHEDERFKPNSKYYGMDHDAYEETITKECISPLQNNKTYESQSDYDPFNINMGQMTVYRLQLQCTCQGDLRVEVGRQRCATVLPFDQQEWPAYMGIRGDGHFNYRKNSK